MKIGHLTAAALVLLALSAAPARAAYDSYTGEVITLATRFCPASTLKAGGQILPIRSYQALFSLLGTTYGGDGINTFALPDLPPTKSAQGAPLINCIVTMGVYPQEHHLAAKAAKQ
jgi:microcystin-dependent protein